MWLLVSEDSCIATGLLDQYLHYMGDSSFGMLDNSATLNAWCSQVQTTNLSKTK